MSTTLLYPYVTLADVKSYCGIGADNTDFDEDVRKAINQVSRYIDRITNRYYYKKTYTSHYIVPTSSYDGWQLAEKDSGGLLFTPQMAPIIDITTLIEDDDTLVENTDFYVHSASGIIEKASSNWASDPREICITCNLGYDSDDTATPSSDLPGDINHYAKELAARWSGHYKKTIKNYVSGGAESIDLFGVPKEIEQALRALRPVSVL